MQRLVVSRHGPPGVLRPVDAADPVPAADDVVIRVARAGVNFADVLSRLGLYPYAPAPPFTPGFEAAGTVAATGAGVTNVAAGDRVVGLHSGGAYATHAVMPADRLAKLPAGVTCDAAAALPVNYLTARLAVVHPGALQPGETLLVHGAAGGVGVAATQLAQLRRAGAIYGTCSPAKHDFLRANGVIPVDRDRFRREVRQATDGRGVDLVLDPIGGKHLMQSYRCLAPGGRLCTFGASAMVVGPRKRRLAALRTWLGFPKFQPLRMMSANRGVFGVNLSTFRDTPRLVGWLRELLGQLADGSLAPVVDRVFPGAEAAAAHRYLQDRRNIGKVLLSFDRDP